MNGDTGSWPPGARRLGAWVFPATYVLHLVEESCCGATFPVWISRHAGVDFGMRAFVWLNLVAMAAMVGAVVVVQRGRAPWMRIALGTIVLVNGAAHTIGSVVTQEYSPGLVTGLLLWLPLGVVTVVAAWHRRRSATFTLGIAAGLVAHGVVSGIVLAC
ncbi:MAG: HXXEE domain-containing protein [Planctomycetes bacterium]|nr:HXXEE domain-containing protein [Planctomycetota bacterium]